MKVVLALHQFPPVGFGGTEELVRWTARALVARGHEAHIVSAVPSPRGTPRVVPPPRVDADGVAVRFLDVSSPSATLERIPLEYDNAKAGEAFGACLDALRPDLVHFHHLAGLTAAAVRATSTRGIPNLISVTDFWFECPTVQLLLPSGMPCAGPDADRANCVRHLLANRLPALAAARPRSTGALTSALAWSSRVVGGRRVGQAWVALQERSPRVREALDAADAVLAPTLFMQDRLERFGVPRERLRLLRYGVPAPAAARIDPVPGDTTSARPLRIAFAGSLASNKGAHLLLQAIAMLPDLAADVVVFGRGAEGDYLRNLERLASADPRVRLAGTFGQGEFAAILARTDVLVIPSLWYENAPLVLLEALANRCPVLVADVPGLVEPMRPDVDGWTFRAGDATDLAARLGWVASHRPALDAVRSREYPTRTTTDYMNDLMPIYEEVRGASGTVR